MSETGDEPEAARPAKSASAYRTIGEVADDLDLPTHVLRFWESKFPRLKPLKRGGGRRYYRPEDIALLRRIRQCLYQDGYTIRGVQKLLGGPVDDDTVTGTDMPTLFPLDGGGGGSGEMLIAAASPEPEPPQHPPAADENTAGALAPPSVPAPPVPTPPRPRRQRRPAPPKATAEAETASASASVAAVPETAVMPPAAAATTERDDGRRRAELEEIRRELAEARALLAEFLQPKPS